jgi:hypothetical protein
MGPSVGGDGTDVDDEVDGNDNDNDEEGDVTLPSFDVDAFFRNVVIIDNTNGDLTSNGSVDFVDVEVDVVRLADIVGAASQYIPKQVGARDKTNNRVLDNIKNTKRRHSSDDGKGSTRLVSTTVLIV